MKMSLQIHVLNSLYVLTLKFPVANDDIFYLYYRIRNRFKFEFDFDFDSESIVS